MAELIRLGLLRADKVGRDWLIEEKVLTEFASRTRTAGRPRKKKS